VLAAFSGGPLGDGRLAAVGPSGWQVAAVGALELGIAAATTAGLANFVSLRRMRAAAVPVPVARPRRGVGAPPAVAPPADHVIYVDTRASDRRASTRSRPAGPSSLS